MLGGTGDLGFGLVLRFAVAGEEVIIGSRKQEKALRRANDANEILKKYTKNRVKGMVNNEAVKVADVSFLTVPYPYHTKTVEGLKENFKEGSILVSTIVPMVKGKYGLKPVLSKEGSVANEIRKVTPTHVRVASAFHNVGAAAVQDLNRREINCDIIVCGEKEAKKVVMELVRLIPGLRPIDGGPLENSVIPEVITPLLVNHVITLKTGPLGVKITNLNFTAEKLIEIYKEKGLI